MSALTYALLSALIISFLSLIGILSLAISDKFLNKILILLVSLSAGSLMGGAFFHLIPETLTECRNFLSPSVYILTGFCVFFMLERILRWHHCHKIGCEIHPPLGHLNLVGDGVHNIIDGLVIIAAFTISPKLGIPVALSIAFHEIPQEIGDFGVLLYAGFKKSKALFYNFLTALSVILGVILGYFLLGRIESVNQFLLPFAAGSFIYIAASDLIPELHKEINLAKSLLIFLIFLIGLILMLGLKLLGE